MAQWLSRSAMLLGEAGVARLERASVAVLGLGGVGSFAAEALARAGIGRLVLIDGDTVSDTNRNRQLAALCSTVGQPKAEVMARRVADINPACRVEARTAYYRGVEGDELPEGLDFAADCIDMVSAKLALAEECARRGLPLISAMGCGNKLDPTRFRVADISKTSVDPLCRVMRRQLRQRGILHLPVVYSEEPPLTPAQPGEAADGRRALPGSVSFVPGAAGLILAGYIIRRLAGDAEEEGG